MKYLILLLSPLFVFTLAHANGWVVFGEDLYRSEKNPWFLRNTSVVKYCVLVDPVGISVPPKEVKEHIGAAFAYWKKEFSSASNLYKQPENGGSVRLGTQTFVETKCDGQEDLRFVVGAGKLTTEERIFVKDVRRYLGLAVRTSYDKVQLRGRGFIYIASDVGPERHYESGLLKGKLWSAKNMLRGTLAHELGHVFGLPHVGTGLMSEAFGEKIASSVFASQFSLMHDLPATLRIPNSTSSCSVSDQLLKFLGFEIPQGNTADTYCLHLQSTVGSPTDLGFTLSVVDKIKKKKTEVGRVVGNPDLATAKDWPFDINMALISFVYLSPEQTVFADHERLRVPDPANPENPAKFIMMDYMLGAAHVQLGYSAILNLKNGQQHSVFLHLSPEGHRVMGLVNG
jgi:hypothetical protein